MLVVGLKRIPIAISGLFLGNIALSHLLFRLHFTFLGLCFFVISCIILLLFITKWIIYPHMFLTELKNIHAFAILPTFSMAIMLLISVIKTIFLIDTFLLTIFWYLAIFLHACLIILFIRFYMFKSYNGFPNTSWFVMFVGIGVIGETSATFNPIMGTLSSIIGTILFVMILAYVLFNKAWHYYNEEQFPMVIIISAPAALCLNSYLLNHENYSMNYVSLFLILSQVLFVFSLLFLPRILKKGFRVSFAALTFPWVTTAASFYNAKRLFEVDDNLYRIINVVTYFEIIWAILIVIYVTYKYVAFLTSKRVVYV